VAEPLDTIKTRRRTKIDTNLSFLFLRLSLFRLILGFVSNSCLWNVEIRLPAGSLKLCTSVNRI
jgi:hypothetical protein